jgi:uncharacterized lipoprotein YajG
MVYPRTLTAVAALLAMALSGCQPAAGSLAVESPAAVPSSSSSEFAAVIQAAVEDRNGTVLDTLPAPRLTDGQATAA